MPYISDKLKLGKKFDRRIKLTDGQREAIKLLYFNARISMRGIAKMYHIDKKTVKFIVFPEAYKEDQALQARQEHWKKYYNREEHTQAVKSYRQYKNKLFKQGKLV